MFRRKAGKKARGPVTDATEPMSAVWEGHRRRPRTLAGATILQIVPALREEPDARAAIEMRSFFVEEVLKAREKPTDNLLSAFANTTNDEGGKLSNFNDWPTSYLGRNERRLREYRDCHKTKQGDDDHT